MAEQAEPQTAAKSYMWDRAELDFAPAGKVHSPGSKHRLIVFVRYPSELLSQWGFIRHPEHNNYIV